MWSQKSHRPAHKIRKLEQRILKALQPAFDVSGPIPPTTPLFLSSPHSGRLYPKAFLAETQVKLDILRRTEDCYVDRIIAPLARRGITQIWATFPRVFVDVNRAPSEWPLELAAQHPNGNAGNTHRARAGLGVIPTRIGEADIYATDLTVDMVMSRLDTLYHPWHRQLFKMIEQTQAMHGHCLLLDIHSMPSYGPDGQYRANIILGNNFGKSARPETTARIQQAFEQAGFSVVLNTPFAGGYITRHYGKPAQKIEVVQIEINKGLYLREDSLHLRADFLDFQARFIRVIESIALNTSRLAADAAQ